MSIVLIVDDETQVRDLLARWITGDGHQMRQVATAVAALDVMELAPADVVLCDVHLPGESGLWLTGQLRLLYPETAIVLATGDKTVPPQFSMQPGVVQYLAKPFTREQVLGAVRLAAGWHETAVSERGHTKVSVPLTKEWIGSSGD